MWFSTITEVIKTLAPVATAGIAFIALRNWKRQEKAKREAEFLDAVIEAVHTYIVQMSGPVTLLQISKIGMKSHAPTWEEGDHATRGAIAYIQRLGDQHSKRLLETLETVRPMTIRLRSLAAKGQVFKFNGYAKCYDAIAMLTSQFDRTEALANVIGSTNLNWENSEVLELLRKVVAIDPDDIRKHLADNNVAILEFARETYGRIYR